MLFQKLRMKVGFPLFLIIRYFVRKNVILINRIFFFGLEVKQIKKLKPKKYVYVLAGRYINVCFNAKPTLHDDYNF